MTPDQVFQIANNLALLTWVFMIIAPRWKWTSRIVVSGVVTLLALCYVYYISQSLKPEDFESFGSLAGVTTLFNNPVAVLAGWIHYLAFDLIAGWFILMDSKRNNINRYLIIPCLLFTFMMGPLGLLLYLLLRWVSTKKYFVDFDA
jgi:hypothetical protein